VILFAGAVGEFPDDIAGQIGEGGRMLTVINVEAGLGRAVLVTRTGGRLARRAIFDAAVPVLPGFLRQTGFVF
jgi:protein-L-isoaspartate(D-aspartate) O-methyltransferase